MLKVLRGWPSWDWPRITPRWCDWRSTLLIEFLMWRLPRRITARGAGRVGGFVTLVLKVSRRRPPSNRPGIASGWQCVSHGRSTLLLLLLKLLTRWRLSRDRLTIGDGRTSLDGRSAMLLKVLRRTGIASRGSAFSHRRRSVLLTRRRRRRFPCDRSSGIAAGDRRLLLRAASRSIDGHQWPGSLRGRFAVQLHQWHHRRRRTLLL